MATITDPDDLNKRETKDRTPKGWATMEPPKQKPSICCILILVTMILTLLAIAFKIPLSF